MPNQTSPRLATECFFEVLGRRYYGLRTVVRLDDTVWLRRRHNTTVRAFAFADEAVAEAVGIETEPLYLLPFGKP